MNCCKEKKKKILIICIVSLCVHLWADQSNMSLLYQSDDFLIYVEDDCDYRPIKKLLELKNNEFSKLFNREIENAVEVYIYQDQKSFNLALFGKEEPFIDTLGAGYWGINVIHLVSPYGSEREPEFLRTIPVHELIHLFWPFEVTWLGEGIAWYWSGQLCNLADIEIPSKFSDMVFWWEGKEKTLHAYNCSGWMVRYIYEELLNYDMERFTAFFNDPSNYGILGISGEEELFNKWQEYVVEMNDVFPLGYKYLIN